ncbi:hypothetical protein MJG53_014080 [Ovis ammon polii x Ovis aries]|uniref:Uncharacterized protein n=1 Tax=Ovis ammon polii x Ovis aries TaxID=2918886 RepID=A0ACB9UKR4_9CETA|nr:hypothetical protein MJG53_014080 [Ovis ammon polii x Ovis aries]
MSSRIDDLEKNIADLMTQAGVEELDVGLQNMALEVMQAATQGLRASVPRSAHPKTDPLPLFHEDFVMTLRPPR